MSEWVDRTFYKRGERGKVEPKIWTIRCSDIRLVVHHINGLEGWFMTTYGGGDFNEHEIKGVEKADKAKAVAMDILVSSLGTSFHRWHDLQKQE